MDKDQQQALRTSASWIAQSAHIFGEAILDLLAENEMLKRQASPLYDVQKLIDGIKLRFDAKLRAAEEALEFYVQYSETPHIAQEALDEIREVVTK